jgi:hypothetical protein
MAWLGSRKVAFEFFKLFFTKALYHGAKKRQAKPLICRDLRCFFEVTRKSGWFYAHETNGNQPDSYHCKVFLLTNLHRD